MMFQNQQPKMQGIERAMIEQDMKDIAEEFSLPISEVDQTLKAEMQRLEQRARIRQFVPLLAIKGVKESLRANQRTPPRAA
jgi:Protein of unknown function (DUF3562)